MHRLAMLDRRQFLRARPPSATAPASATPRATGSGAPRPVGDLSPFVPSAADPWDAAKARHLLRRVSMAALPADVTALVSVAPGEAVRRLVAAAQRQPTLSEPDWIGIRQPPSSAPQAERNAYNQANLTAFREMARGVQNRLLGGTGARADRLGMALRERMALVWCQPLRHRVPAATASQRGCSATSASCTSTRSAASPTWSTPSGRPRPCCATSTATKTGSARPTRTTRASCWSCSRWAPKARTAPRRTPSATSRSCRAPRPGGAPTSEPPSRSRSTPTASTRERRPSSARPARSATTDVTPLLFAERATQIAHFRRRRALTAPSSPTSQTQAWSRPSPTGWWRTTSRWHRPSRRSWRARTSTTRATSERSSRAPVDLVVGAAQAFGAEAFDLDQANYARNQMARIGQELFNPPDVAGWPGGTSWIDTSSWPERVKRGEALVQRAWQTIADDVAARPSAYSARDLAAELASELLPRPPSAEELDGFVEVLLSGTPDYAWDPTTNGGRTRVRDYVKHLVSLPEFQLR